MEIGGCCAGGSPAAGSLGFVQLFTSLIRDKSAKELQEQLVWLSLKILDI